MSSQWLLFPYTFKNSELRTQYTVQWYNRLLMRLHFKDFDYLNFIASYNFSNLANRWDFAVFSHFVDIYSWVLYGFAYGLRAVIYKRNKFTAWQVFPPISFVVYIWSVANYTNFLMQYKYVKYFREKCYISLRLLCMYFSAQIVLQ